MEIAKKLRQLPNPPTATLLTRAKSHILRSKQKVEPTKEIAICEENETANKPTIYPTLTQSSGISDITSTGDTTAVQTSRGSYVKREIFLQTHESKKTKFPGPKRTKNRINLTPLNDPCLDIINVTKPFAEVSPIITACLMNNFSEEQTRELLIRALSKSRSAEKRD